MKMLKNPQEIEIEHWWWNVDLTPLHGLLSTPLPSFWYERERECPQCALHCNCCRTCKSFTLFFGVGSISKDSPHLAHLYSVESARMGDISFNWTTHEAGGSSCLYLVGDQAPRHLATSPPRQTKWNGRCLFWAKMRLACPWFLVTSETSGRVK